VLKVRAHAKLNLSLEIVDRRDDGFHDLVSVMQTISLADTLVVEEAADVIFRCSDPALETQGNLVVAAARLLQSRCGVSRGCSLYLHKEIPAAAGLGGGSSDAATTLAGLNRLWNAGASCSDLLAMSEELGSDVPFFLYGGIALVEGRGEIVTRLPDPRPVWYVLARPSVDVSTARIFAALSREEWTNGETTYDLARSIAAGEKPYRVGINDLQGPLFRLFPEAYDCFSLVSSLAPDRTFVSGSGPTVAAVFDNRRAAVTAASALPTALGWVRVARSSVPQPEGSPCV
jgi:4-diphosphocytidyl-2-C-methyl-D-erythritol kinase